MDQEVQRRGFLRGCLAMVGLPAIPFFPENDDCSSTAAFTTVVLPCRFIGDDISIREGIWFSFEDTEHCNEIMGVLASAERATHEQVWPDGTRVLKIGRTSRLQRGETGVRFGWDYILYDDSRKQPPEEIIEIDEDGIVRSLGRIGAERV